MTTVVNGLLKGRQFGASLYVSDIFNAIQTQVAGISFLNVTLPDPAPVGGVYDVHGNLIIDAAHVITRGLVSVNQAST